MAGEVEGRAFLLVLEGLAGLLGGVLVGPRVRLQINKHLVIDKVEQVLVAAE